MGAMVLGKLPVPERPTNMVYSRARAYCACRRCGWGCLDIFSSSIVSLLFSFSLSLGDSPIYRYRLKYCLKGPFSPKQPNKQTNKQIVYEISTGQSQPFDT